MRSKSVHAALALLIFVLSASSQTAITPKPIDLLKQKLEQISSGVSADWGIYIKSLDTGEEIAINADKVMDTMSAIKIPLLVDVYRQVDAGKINTADRFAMKTADKRFGTGVLRTLDCRLEPKLSRCAGTDDYPERQLGHRYGFCSRGWPSARHADHA